jgi:LuxR family maltose regulon positive regulatory protein
VQGLVATGRLAPARALLEAAARPHPPELAPLDVALAVAEGSLPAAEAALAGWPPVDGHTRSRLDQQLWTAIVHLKRGRRPEALRVAAAAIAAAEADGHRRFVLDAGTPGVQLLRSVLQAAPTPHAHRIAAAASEQVLAMGGPDLTERELEVVRYLPTPLSNAEMAARLYVSLNTLKTHLRAIYRKLGVKGRREAIRRAEELGIA